MEPSNVDTQTYLFVEDVVRQPRSIPGYPEPVLPSGRHSEAPLDYEMDPEIVNDPRYGDALRRGFRDIPTVALALPREQMFGEGGIYYASDGRGPTHTASVEILDPRKPARSTQADCGLESHATEGLKRSFKLKFQAEHGPGKLRTWLFQDAPENGDSATDLLDRIVLRSGNLRSFAIGGYPDKTTYTRDQWARDAQIELSGAGSHGTFVHLFINGIYWGLYNACERPDSWFTSAYLGGEVDDWFAVNHGGPFRGDPTRWDHLMTVLKNEDLREPDLYAEVQEFLDVERFVDYLLIAFLTGYGDWPKNNWYGGNRNDPPTPFRFFVWDAEVSWVDVRRPDGARRSADKPWRLQEPFRSSNDASRSGMAGLWHALRRNPEFKMLFADRVHEVLSPGGALSDDRSLARWHALNRHIEDAVVAESARWGDARASLGEPTRTRDETFYPEADKVAGMMSGAAFRLVTALRDQGYYPRPDPPRVDGPHESYGDPARITIDNPNPRGVIFYTLDGADPRAPGGSVARGALKLDGDGVTMETSGELRARVRMGTEWSAVAAHGVCVTSPATRLAAWLTGESLPPPC